MSLKSVNLFADNMESSLKKMHLVSTLMEKTEPGQHKLTILGLALNVSEAWLMGYDVPMERESAVSSAQSQKVRTVEFVTLFNRLSPDQQKMIIAQIKGILSDET